MHAYNTLADDYYVNVVLNTEMNLPTGRETVLGFFERVQKSYPAMRRFYTRDSGEVVLEEDKEQGHQRWLSLEARRICSGYFSPPSTDAAMEQHHLVLELAPYMLSVSPIDVEALDVMIGFDFNYRGNHDALVAEALGTGSALDGLTEIEGAQILNYEPSMRIALDEECRRQARLLVETRTTPYQVRRKEYSEDMISVYLTIRQYGSLEVGATFEQTLNEMRQQAEDLVDSYVIQQVLRPLSEAIAARG